MRKIVANTVENPGVNQVSKTDSFPDLLNESELIRLLRIPEVSDSQDYSNVVRYLIRYRDLPRIHLCKKLLFPRKAILEWIEHETVTK